MQNKLFIVIVLVFVGCAPAKWKETLGDTGNSSLGAPVDSPSSPIAASETFQQDYTANKVDILIVNDNSASMDPEQQKMSARFASFVSELRGIDYRIAMTTTDLDSAKYNQDGRILTWLGTKTDVLIPVTYDAENVFRRSVARPETIGCQGRHSCPSGNEQPLRAIERAIDHRADANANLFRPGVDFVAVVLSDEDEMSNAPSRATTADDVVAHFRAAFGPDARFAVHGLVIEPGDTKCLAAQAAQPASNGEAYYGTRVAALTSLTGGTLNSICDDDYGADLASISSEVRKLVSTFELHATPRAGSVTVNFTPAFKTTWTLEANKLIFNPAPPAGTKFTVNYRY